MYEMEIKPACHFRTTLTMIYVLTVNSFLGSSLPSDVEL